MFNFMHYPNFSRWVPILDSLMVNGFVQHTTLVQVFMILVMSYVWLLYTIYFNYQPKKGMITNSTEYVYSVVYALNTYQKFLQAAKTTLDYKISL